MELSLAQYIGSIGGVAGILSLMIFLMYRKMVDQMRQDRVFMEDRLTKVIAEYNTVCRENNDSIIKHTQVLTELIVWLKAKNGN